MLAEGFLRVLRYREERKLALASQQGRHVDRTDQLDSGLPDSNSIDLQRDSAETVNPNQEEQATNQFQGLKVVPQAAAGLSIPGCSPVPILDPDFIVGLEDCSLLEQYPDLQVADSGRISQNRLRTNSSQNALGAEACLQPEQVASQEPQGHNLLSIPDQGYLVMGATENISLDLPGLEPMSNSVLNGLLDKQLEEVYMQHLTDNLARCNSNLGNSLLHGLVPPPQPSSHAEGPDSLEACLEEGCSGGRSKISYLSTQNLVPCSSNFSSPVLRISEVE